MKTRKKQKSVYGLINTIILIIILIILVGKELSGFLNKKTVEIIDQKENVWLLRTSQVFDSVSNRTGTKVWIENSNETITVWNDCPSEKIATKKPLVKKEKKVNREVDFIGIISKVDTSKVEVPKKENNIEKVFNLADTLNVLVEKITNSDTSLLFSEKSVLPMTFDGKNTRTFNYDFVADIQVQESWRKAKKHIVVGTGVASLGFIAYGSTFFFEVPTFVNHDNIGFFDKTNKYYDRNIYEQKRLKTLKWVRGTAIGLSILGTMDTFYGVSLLKDAKIEVAPQKISLKYNF